MTQDEFDNCIRTAMAEKRSWFTAVEPPASQEDLAKVELKIGRPLPDEFKHFALTFGGGYFGRANVSTFIENSEWYILSRPVTKINGESLLVVSDDETGGYFGFLPDAGKLKSNVFYSHFEDDEVGKEVSNNFFDFIVDFAINF